MEDHSYDVPKLGQKRPDIPPTKYDTPGTDIRNVHELADPTRNVRIKAQYTGSKAPPAPASQIDAFEFYGGRRRRRRTHRRGRTHRRTKRHTRSRRSRRSRR